MKMYGRALLRLVGLLFCASTAMLAQSHAYVFFGPGGVTSAGATSGAAYMGAGGDYVSRIGLGAGVEVGYVAPWRRFRSGIGIGSANGTYHFRRNGRLSPFVTGGYTLFFRTGTANGFNFGGGVNWWLADRFGLKAEVRDQVGLGGLRGFHFWAVRAAVTFR
jgi:hypothetical protein